VATLGKCVEESENAKDEGGHSAKNEAADPIKNELFH